MNNTFLSTKKKIKTPYNVNWEQSKLKQTMISSQTIFSIYRARRRFRAAAPNIGDSCVQTVHDKT